MDYKLKSDDDYDTRLSKLKLLLLFNKRFIRDVTQLMDIMILTFQTSSYFLRTETQVITWLKMAHRTLLQILELKVLNIAVLTVLFTNGMVYLIIFIENQKVFHFLKAMC